MRGNFCLREHPSLAVRVFRCIGIPFERRGACAANSLSHPPPLPEEREQIRTLRNGRINSANKYKNSSTGAPLRMISACRVRQMAIYTFQWLPMPIL